MHCHLALALLHAQLELGLAVVEAESLVHHGRELLAELLHLELEHVVAHHLVLLVLDKHLERLCGRLVFELELANLALELGHVRAQDLVAPLPRVEVVAQAFELRREHGVLRRGRLHLLGERLDLLGEVSLLRLSALALHAADAALEQLEFKVRVVHKLALALGLLIELADAAARVAARALGAVDLGEGVGLLLALLEEMLRLLVRLLLELLEGPLGPLGAHVRVLGHLLHLLGRLLKCEGARPVGLELCLGADERLLLALQGALLVVEEGVHVGCLILLVLQLGRRFGERVLHHLDLVRDLVEARRGPRLGLAHLLQLPLVVGDLRVQLLVPLLLRRELLLALSMERLLLT
mmetsp:Transcript_19163/g.51610  ORF Transcript_19163/g.51610 Transcript_19163/m.51610 type:complete len:352 (-) Transcript_19163:951-2006(-)